MTATRRNRAQLSVETLESRCLLSTAPTRVTAVYDIEPDPVTGVRDRVLHVFGTPGDDTIFIHQGRGSNPSVEVATSEDFNAASLVPIKGAPAAGLTINIVDRIWVDAGDGNNDVEVSGPGHSPAYLKAGAGDDTLVGGAGDDYLDGGAGRDILKGGPNHNTYKKVFTVFGDGADQDDIRHVSSAPSPFLAALSAVVRTPNQNLAGRVKDLGHNTFDVTLYLKGKPVIERISYDGTYYDVGGTGKGYDGVAVLNDSTGHVEAESWVILYQLAFNKYLKDLGSPAANGTLAMQALTGHDVTITVLANAKSPNPDPSEAALAQALQSGKAVIALALPENPARKLADGRINEVLDDTVGIMASHYYTVTQIDADGTVHLWNPWGKDTVDGARNIDPVRAYNKTGSDKMDGYLTMSWSQFRKLMKQFYVA
jgi:Ca2+-binding RTX toxin-like protein